MLKISSRPLPVLYIDSQNIYCIKVWHMLFLVKPANSIKLLPTSKVSQFRTPVIVSKRIALPRVERMWFTIPHLIRFRSLARFRKYKHRSDLNHFTLLRILKLCTSIMSYFPFMLRYLFSRNSEILMTIFFRIPGLNIYNMVG